MRPKRIPTSLIYWPGTNRLLRQPLGVAGIVAPWNYPLQLTLGPTVGALAAGNRVMLKPSEFVPQFSSLLQHLISERFTDEEIVVVTGGADVSRALCALPFDHLLFTGSTAVGKMVAEAAGRNLTPVTLELGGKSPAIIHSSADIEAAAGRIAYAKILNAGQTCIAPDYVICAPERSSAFEHAYRQAVSKLIGDAPANPDYSSIISGHHIARLKDLLGDAVAKGARIIYAVDNPDAWTGSGKVPPYLAFETTDEMRLRREEIFGPILPVVTAPTDSDAIAIVNAGDRPLALYWFGTDRNALDRVLHETVSGGVTVNDCLLHQVQESQPFGGVGASGMGAYHGEWGFRTFSKEKPVFHRPRMSGAARMRPPYGKTFDRMLDMIRRLS
jgi:coniferyl-aldehyde dehydrogenase